MFDQLGSFDEVFGDGGEGGAPHAKPIRCRKPVREWTVFVAANAVVMPIVGLIYASVIAEGLRVLMPVFERKIYKLPIPGAGLARNYDGWDRLDLALVLSLLLFAVGTWLWTRVFIESQGYGTIAQQRLSNPVIFYMAIFVAVVFIGGDAGIFYIGLTTQSASGWTEGPDWVAPGATLIYMCGLAIVGWWHADFRTSSYT